VKADEISFGYHTFGNFLVGIQSCVFDTRGADEVEFFEVLVLEQPGNYYVDLQADPRFLWFDHFGKFERRLTDVDLVEYNARYSTIFHKIGMPTWKLGRHSVVALERLCLDATKKAKRGK
jgi:hypothetical protein